MVIEGAQIVIQRRRLPRKVASLIGARPIQVKGDAEFADDNRHIAQRFIGVIAKAAKLLVEVRSDISLADQRAHAKQIEIEMRIEAASEERHAIVEMGRVNQIASVVKARRRREGLGFEEDMRLGQRLMNGVRKSWVKLARANCPGRSSRG